MMDEISSENRIQELEKELGELKDIIAEYQDEAERKAKISLAKVKGVIDARTNDLINAVKPILEKYEEPSKAAVAKVGTKVSENPFLSVVVAFGAGIVIGKLLDMCCRRAEEAE